MANKIVSVPYILWLDIEIETDLTDDDEIIDEAISKYGGLSGFAGNGGTGKLVGTTCPNVTIEAPDHYFEDDVVFPTVRDS